MRIQRAELFDFRNIVRASLCLAPRLTALVGPNGQGKTNAIEALYTLAALRPLRSIPRTDLIRAGAERASVRATVHKETNGLEHELALELRRGGRALEKDGKRVEAGAFLGHLVAVAFTPDELEVSKGAPELRRKLLDRTLLGLRPAYLAIALRYARALKARNRLLVDGGPDELLDAYDAQIAEHGAAIAVARAELVSRFGPRAISRFESIATPAPLLEVAYASTLKDALKPTVAETRDAFAAKLLGRRRLDRERRKTTVGPHLDDLELLLDGAPARLRASQGQHRALVLALKLAEIEQLTEALGEPPVLLLDDISSELDAERSRQLFEALSTLAGQVVLTTADERQVPVKQFGGDLAVYDVRGGALTERAA